MQPHEQLPSSRAGGNVLYGKPPVIDVPSPLPQRPLRVLFLNDTSRNGGPARSLYTILKHTAPCDVHRVVVLPRPGVVSDLLADVSEAVMFLPDFVENPIEPRSRPMARADFDANGALKGWRAATNVVRGARAIGVLAGWVRRGDFDLIYCNGTSADFAGATVAAMTGVPALWHVRYTHVPEAVAALHRRLAASDAVRRIVCVSQAAARLFAHCPDKVHVIHNAVDTDEFSPTGERRLRRELGFGDDAIVIGAHGRVLPRKGFDVFVRSARMALDAMDATMQARVKFVIVGDTPEDIHPDHVPELQHLVRTLGLGACVTLLGFRADVRPYVRDFDVEIVPSVYEDPLPRAVLEAMALGVPVIASNVGGVSEMLGTAEGTLVPPGDAEALSTEIVHYAKDPALRKRLGAACLTRIARDFDAPAHGAAIGAEMLRAVFGEGKAAR